MARTILAIAREAAQRRNTAPLPETLFGSSGNRIARILQTAAYDTLRDYLRQTNWTGTSELSSTWVFSTEPGRYAYPLPPDLLRVVPNTEHRGGWPLGLVGPASPQSWAAWLHGGVATPVQAAWRIRNNAIWFDPTPAAKELIAIEYVSRYPVVSQIKEGDYDDTQSPPVCVAPFVPRDGHMDLRGLSVTDATPVAGTYEEPPGWDVAVWGQETFEALKRLSKSSGIQPLPQVRRPEFTADTDFPAFEDDHLLSLGMTMRLRRGLGLDHTAELSEYEREIEAKMANDAGGARDIRIGGNGCFPGAYPLGGNKWLVS